MFSRRFFNEHEGPIFISIKDLNQHLFKDKYFWTFVKFMKNVKGSIKGDIKLQNDNLIKSA